MHERRPNAQHTHERTLSHIGNLLLLLFVEMVHDAYSASPCGWRSFLPSIRLPPIANRSPFHILRNLLFFYPLPFSSHSLHVCTLYMRFGYYFKNNGLHLMWRYDAIEWNERKFISKSIKWTCYFLSSLVCRRNRCASDPLRQRLGLELLDRHTVRPYVHRPEGDAILRRVSSTSILHEEYMRDLMHAQRSVFSGTRYTASILWRSEKLCILFSNYYVRHQENDRIVNVHRLCPAHARRTSSPRRKNIANNANYI